MDEAAELEALRPRAFAIAYRMLGSVAEAEDVVQEAMLRFHREVADPAESAIEAPQAWLSTVVSRLALDELRSARARREVYVGEWLPEPLVGVGGSQADDPAAEAETADSLSLAFLVLLESLTPEQRAAFLLHDVFDYRFDEVAEIVGTSAANARQLASRARREVEARRPRFESSAERRDRLADGFFAAFGEGDVAGLERLLAEDIELHGDGGGEGSRPCPAHQRPRPRRSHHERLVEGRLEVGRAHARSRVCQWTAGCASDSRGLRGCRHGSRYRATAKSARFVRSSIPTSSRTCSWRTSSGGGGIRTPGPGNPVSGFQDRRIQPLCHPSGSRRSLAAPRVA